MIELSNASADHHDDEHDLGLAHDLVTLAGLRARGVSRRRALKLFGGAGLLSLAACSSKVASIAGTKATASSTPATSDAVATSAAGTTSTALANPADGSPADGGPPPGGQGGPPPGGGGGPGGGGAGSQPTDGTIPMETGGPFPGDGTNGPNALNKSGIVRSDITSSLGSSTKAPGVPLAVKLKITKGSGGAALAGAAVYIWHADQQGRYSMYSPGVTNETWLRGVQEADANGELTFNTVYPGCYDGRWPHIHFEVFPTLAAAAAGKPKLATSQLAMTEVTAKQVYTTTGYTTSTANLAKVTLKSDNVFSDGADRETPTFTGDATAGFVASLVVPVAG
jgi:protocatechuate 3,4-dioxygenase beta subunit